ncbi:MAG: ATP-dependent helicase [Tepidisphaeraceae bacterium]|jgi:DNA helicase-2/ATP-dependent DNA helicase PcrA
MEANRLANLNDQQHAAATFGDAPLLIIAGAGTGKTNTLAHRVAALIGRGASPERILLLTFTRRAATEMLTRVRRILATPVISDRSSAIGVGCSATPARQDDHRLPTTDSRSPTDATAAPLSRLWGGTFHSVAARLLRIYCKSIGLDETFTVLDRGDSEDLLDVVRGELKLDRSSARFPRKGTCMSIYSRCVNAQEPIEKALKMFPWCEAWADQLKLLFRDYTARKHEQNVLDYDDLLLYWFHLMQDDAVAAEVRARFDHVLVDEYQDTNLLQAGILERLRPAGRGLTVVGDDAQAIYSFRAATVHNILDFPRVFPGAEVLKLERNYRSTQPILDAANAVIAQSPQRYHKELFTTRTSLQKPRLVTLMDEDQQSRYIVQRILEHLEAGIALKKQAVLFRTAHHSDALEVELSKKNIPFVKYGGLKFLEAAHVKDVLAILRLAENPRDSASGLRVLTLIDGIGPATARRAMEHLAGGRFDPAAWKTFAAPPAAEQWPALVELLCLLRSSRLELSAQLGAVRNFYTPLLEKRYDQAHLRARDIEQLERISSNFASRQQLLTDLTLDPPHSTQDLAGEPLLDEDYLILSTVHSAKGCEWDAVYVLHAADGNIPSDMATGSDEEIEEERRLFYVALTRAKDFLDVCFPLKYYHKKWATGDRHTYAQLTRFLPDSVVDRFERVSLETPGTADPISKTTAGDVRKKIAAMWT